MNWHEYFTYDAETGVLRWRDGIVRYRNKVGGKKAGTRLQRPDGGRKGIGVYFNGRRYGAHLIIWEMFNGALEAGMVVDHINRNPWDNRLSNLRSASKSQNTWNSSNPCNSTIPIKGVTGRKGSMRYPWKAELVVAGQRVFTGIFKTKGEAALAYAKASLMHHGRFSIYYRQTNQVSHDRHRTTGTEGGGGATGLGEEVPAHNR